MTTRTRTPQILAAAMILTFSAPAFAQTSDDDHAAHHPEAETSAPAPGGAPMEGMMDMMTPEMMQMMMRMMREGGMQGQGTMPGRMGGMADAPMGHGMMGMRGQGDMPMGRMMRGQHGAMGGHGLGPDALYGMPQGAVTEMTPARVAAFLSHLLERHANPRLELGEVAEAEDGSITAEIVTIDGSLVQRLSFNRYPGLFRQID
ncbi:hypothetical protein LY56_02223 [Roseinatronobacter thiooxidans]|uniref:YpeB-like protein with protease inhibitory function n=1 Tax=Roseinatronobacter thiooxidans TaxID=121821 RepID=A0A2W7RUX7_9RHOB|nr:hypothetical protein [Roseinatronobacter thiooxidans]PZX41932.1 hypothetical protein LY56_02223 [Roseinatronobacter thiooxidans]